MYLTALGALLAAAALIALVQYCLARGRGHFLVPGRGSGSMNRWFLVYTYPLPPPGELMSYVLEDGKAELTASGEPVGFTTGHHGEIGNYSHDFGAETGRRLRPLVEAAVAESPGEDDPSAGPIYAGTPVLAFGFGFGKRLKRLVGASMGRALAPATMQLHEEMGRILRELLRHPVRTISGSAQWDPKAGTPGAQLALTVRITNSGKETVEIANPAAAKQGEETVLTLHVFADTGQPLQAKDWKTVELLGGEIRDNKTPSPKPLAVLDPGQSLDLDVTVRRQTFLTPGRYTARVDYASGSRRASSKRAIDGMLRIVTPRLVIQPPDR